MAIDWKEHDRIKRPYKPSGSESKLNKGLNAIAGLIEHAQDDICRAQRRLEQKGEGVARSEALSAKEYLNTAIVVLNEIGI